MRLRHHLIDLDRAPDIGMPQELAREQPIRTSRWDRSTWPLPEILNIQLPEPDEVAKLLH
jgi:hypothetical protein